MTTFRWKAIEEYSPFCQLLANHMWEQRPPLNPAQLSHLTGIDYSTIYRWFQQKASPDPVHLLRLAQCLPIPVQTLFVAAGYGLTTFPLFSLAEAWEYVINQVRNSQHVGSDAHDDVLVVLDLVREEDLGRRHCGDYAAQQDLRIAPIDESR